MSRNEEISAAARPSEQKPVFFFFCLLTVAFVRITILLSFLSFFFSFSFLDFCLLLYLIFVVHVHAYGAIVFFSSKN